MEKLQAKRNYFVFVLAVLQLLALFLVNKMPYQEILVRSFNGRGVVVQPLWVSLAILAALIFTMRPLFSCPVEHNGRHLLAGLQRGLLFLAFPVFSGLAMYDFSVLNFFQWRFNLNLLLVFVQFILAFVAINLMWQTPVIKNKVLRVLLFLIFGFLPFLSYVENIFLILGILSGLAMTFFLATLAFQKDFALHPLRGVSAQFTVGVLSIFLLVGAKSDNLFTILIPLLAMALGTILLRRQTLKPALIGLFSTVLLSFVFGYLLPERVNHPFFAGLNERKTGSLEHTEQVGTITIKYNDERVRPLLVRLAKVLEAANQVSEEAFGISPKVNTLIVSGFAPGGFYAQFPDQIVGNFISPLYVERCLDSTFLKVDVATIDFPDPVNGLLHEYAHLFGIASYFPWLLGAEEEGWATYGAVTLAQLLDQKYGQQLWDPPYNYAAFARAITDSNLHGRPVGWSHPEEFTGFQLWHGLGEKLGLKTLFRKRWSATHRTPLPPRFYLNDPAQAMEVVNAFGEEHFLPFAQLPPQPLKSILPFAARKPLADLMGLKNEEALKKYQQSAEQMIDPSIPLPQKNVLWVDLLLCVLVIGLGGVLGIFKEA